MIFIRNKTLSVLFVTLTISVLFLMQACGTDSADSVFTDQEGELKWAYAPARDGRGIIFITSDTTYGAPGSRSDYSDYFREDENQVNIIADFEITGNETVRGWGVTYPEIEFLRIERLE